MELLVIAILLAVSGAQQSQLKGLQNTLSIVGSNVTLKCSTPSGNCSNVDWLKTTPQTNPETVFDSRTGEIINAYRDRYSVDGSSGCDLVIKNVKLTDAGRFTCRVFISSSSEDKNAYLFILKTQQKCAINASLGDTVKGDGVQLKCEVTYNGTGKVSMLWKDVENAPSAVVNGKTISRSYSVVASAHEVPSFTCVTSFEVDIKGVNTASNVPNASCATSAIKVFYPVMNVTLSLLLSDYSRGTVITCMAKGHPPPTLRWQARKSESNGTWMDIQSQSGNQFAVSEVNSGRYRCLAMNAVRGVSYNSTSDEFQVNNKDRFEVGIGIGCGIGFLVAILLASIAFAILVRQGFLDFHPRPHIQSLADVAQPMKEKKTPSSHRHSSIPGREAESDEQQESAYASLRNDRDTNEYESLEQRQKAKP